MREAEVADSPPSPSSERPSRAANAQDAVYLALHGERAELERALTLARQRQQFGSNPAEIEAARMEEASLLKDLDRILTMIRAAEIKRRPGGRRWQ
ncbi:hypothetical protein [Methylobacterium organophilum]|uniref:hypothetical protein n=1 Tax=Methylobacterium organophilum TaxID=410 RepID=UPI003B849F4D